MAHIVEERYPFIFRVKGGRLNKFVVVTSLVLLVSVIGAFAFGESLRLIQQEFGSEPEEEESAIERVSGAESEEAPHRLPPEMFDEESDTSRSLGDGDHITIDGVIHVRVVESERREEASLQTSPADALEDELSEFYNGIFPWEDVSVTRIMSSTHAFHVTRGEWSEAFEVPRSYSNHAVTTPGRFVWWFSNGMRILNPSGDDSTSMVTLPTLTFRVMEISESGDAFHKQTR